MRPIARIICWNCRDGSKQLFRVKDEYGFKTPDYVCVDCKALGKWEPPIGNMSKMYFPTEEQLKRIREVLAQQQAQEAQKVEGEKVVPIEGDPVAVVENENLPNMQ